LSHVPGDGEDSDSQRIVDAFISEVYLFDHALNGKQLELSTPKFHGRP